MRRSVLLHLIAAASALIAACGCAEIIVSRGLASARSKVEVKRTNGKNRKRWEKLVPGIMPWTDSLLSCGVMRDTFIMSGECRLHAMYVPSEGISRRTAIVVHGYDAGPFNVMMLARMYRDSLGFNVLAPSLRHHCYSGGDFVQMGWKDRLDLLLWAEVAHRHFNDTLQVFHGVSMGAAAVMMASGEETPEYVRGFVEDCGYTSVWDEVVYAMDRYIGKDSTFVRKMETLAVDRYGLDFHEASSVKQISSCEKPMLFIHGDADELVPVDMAHYNYDAKKEGYRELWIAPGSAHSRAFPDYPAEYTETVRKFLRDHVISGK